MDLLHRLLFTALSAATIVYFIIKIKLAYWKNRGILHKKPTFFYGNLKGVGKKRHISQAIQEVYNIFKLTDAPFVGFFNYIRPLVLITKLDLVQSILANDTNAFELETFYHNTCFEPLTIDFIKIKNKHAKMPMPKLTKQVDFILPSLLSVADVFQKALEQQQTTKSIFNVNDLVDGFNIDVTASLILGLESNSLKYPNNEFRTFARNFGINRIPAYELLTQTYPYLAEFLNYKSFDPLQAEHFWKLLKDKHQERSWNQNHQHKDLLKRLMDFMEQQKKKYQLSEQAIAAKAFSFIFSHLEYLNAALSFCLNELALNPEIQEALRKEISSVLNKYNGKLTAESFTEMSYLQQVLKENQRLHPVTTFLVYTAIKSFEVPNTVFMIKKSNRVVIPTMAIHRDPLIYDEPLKFNPDRFSAANLQQHKPGSFLPLKYGWSSFIDAHTAQMQLAVGLITILRQYHLSPCSETEIPLIYDNQRMLLYSKPDIKLMFERIKS